MSRKGNGHDKAIAERFFATIEFELLTKHHGHIRAEARRAIFRDLGTWCNRNRRHSMLGPISPAEYEASPQQAA